MPIVALFIIAVPIVALASTFIFYLRRMGLKISIDVKYS